MKDEIAVTAERKTSLKTWFCLGMMSAQFGILARLTWWEYSWDIMEPVTYFVTYGTVMAGFAYYCLTNQVNIYVFNVLCCNVCLGIFVCVCVVFKSFAFVSFRFLSSFLLIFRQISL